MQSNSGPSKLEVASTLTSHPIVQELTNIDPDQNPHSDSKDKGRDERRQELDFNPQQNSSQRDDDEVSNPESKKPSAEEINEEIDLKKNRNRSISAVLAGCAIVPMVVLGLMAFGVINVSSFVLFPGYGASEVVLGLVGISALSQVSLAFTSMSGVSKIEEKKSRIYDGVNPSVEQDIHDRKLKDERERKKQEESQGKTGEESASWIKRLDSQRAGADNQRVL
jgi:hypothetical protein